MNLRKSSETEPLINHAIMTSIRYIAELLANAQLYIEVTLVAFKSGTLFVRTNITSVSRLYIDDRSQLKVHTDVLSLRNTFTTYKNKNSAEPSFSFDRCQEMQS